MNRTPDRDNSHRSQRRSFRHDSDGKPLSVRYEAINAMLLNEFLKEHRKVEEQSHRAHEQDATIAQLKSTVAQQQKGMAVLSATLREQASQIQKVSTELALNKATTGTLAGNQ